MVGEPAAAQGRGEGQPPEAMAAGASEYATGVVVLGDLGDAFNNIQRFINPTAAGIQDFEEAIREKAKAMGYDATQTLAWVHAEERRAEAEAGRARTTAAVAEVDKRMADITAEVRYELGLYEQAVKDGGDAEVYNAAIMQRKLDLNADLVPLMAERNRLLGIEAEQQAAATGALVAQTDAGRRAEEALKAFTAAQKKSALMAGILTDAWTGAMEDVEESTKQAAKNVPGLMWNMTQGIVDKVRSGIPDVRSVMKDFRWAIEHPMKLASTRAEIEGALTSKKLARGMRSNIPFVRQAAIDARSELMTSWNAMPGMAMELGRLTIAELVRGLNTGEQYALGLYGTTGTKSGDRKIDKRTHPKKKAGGGPVYAGQMYEVNEGGRREFFAPALNGTVLSANQTAAMGNGGGGTTVHLTVNFQSAATPTEADGERIAAAIGPALTRWQRRQGVVR